MGLAASNKRSRSSSSDSTSTEEDDPTDAPTDAPTNGAAGAAASGAPHVVCVAAASDDIGDAAKAATVGGASAEHADTPHSHPSRSRSRSRSPSRNVVLPSPLFLFWEK